MTTFTFHPLWPDATDEQKREQVRLWRDTELARTDWTMTSDAPTDKEAWAVYRQALRDLPVTIDLANPVLPDPPA